LQDLTNNGKFEPTTSANTTKAAHRHLQHVVVVVVVVVIAISNGNVQKGAGGKSMQFWTSSSKLPLSYQAASNKESKDSLGPRGAD
jgi:hypothetical protein